MTEPSPPPPRPLADDPPPAGGYAARRRRDWGTRLGAIVFELLILAAVWYFLRIKLPIVGGIAAIIVAVHVVPERFGTPTLGVGLIGLAALIYFRYRNPTIAGLCVVVGIICLLPMLLVTLARATGATPPRTPPPRSS